LLFWLGGHARPEASDSVTLFLRFGERRYAAPTLLLLTAIGAIAWGQWCWLGHQLARGLPWILGGLAAAMASRLAGGARESPVPTSPKPLARWELVFLALLILAGGAIRFMALENWPPGGFFDEVQNHLVAEQILAGWRPVFVADASQMPAFYFYLLAGAIRLAGKGLTTVRGLSALIGTLTLPAYYLLARRSFALPVAAASSLFLAGSRWHLTFSRVGFTGIFGPLFEVLAMLTLWKALETGKLRFHALFGVVVGLGLQSYYSFNLFPAVLAVAVVAYSFRRGPREFVSELARAARGLAVAALVAAVLLAPLARFALQNREVFFQRAGTVVLWNPAHHLSWPRALRDNAVAHLLMFQFRGDGNARHNIPDDPMLNPIAGLLLTLGLGGALARFRFPQAVWLSWFAVMLVPAVVTIEAPQAYRSIGVIPAVALLVGEGCSLVFEAGAGKTWRVTAISVLLALVALGSGAIDVSRYFRVQVRHRLAWPAFEGDYHALARYLRPYGGKYDIWVSSVFYDYPIMRFHLGEGFPYRRLRLSEHLPLEAAPILPFRQGVLYALEPFQAEAQGLFRELYPQAEIQEHRDPDGRVMFVSVRVPESQVRTASLSLVTGFLGSYYANDHFEGSAALTRRDPGVCFHFHWSEEALPAPFSVDWAAHLQVDTAGTYTFQVRASAPAVLVVDGRSFRVGAIDRDTFEPVSVDLAKGDHLLVMRYIDKGWAALACLLWQPPNQTISIIPMSDLRPLTPEEYDRLRSTLPMPKLEAGA
jgi:4-amino-4-deoxy-L-arabinose transferase-like glycosyltransferase